MHPFIPPQSDHKLIASIEIANQLQGNVYLPKTGIKNAFIINEAFDELGKSATFFLKSKFSLTFNDVGLDIW